jgi:hypothetical protein
MQSPYLPPGGARNPLLVADPPLRRLEQVRLQRGQGMLFSLHRESLRQRQLERQFVQTVSHQL